VQAEIVATRSEFVVQQRNAEKLRYQGIELATGYRTSYDMTVGLNYTYLDSERLDSTNPPTGDTYGDKVVFYMRWEPEREPFWFEYRFRYNASTPVNLDANEPLPPVGDELPSFQVHTLAGGVRLFERGRFAHDLRFAVENLTDELYAEFSNATFFRPEPGRSYNASYRLRF
jgi:outer membrane receptor protein involved in Fe transport